MRKSLFASAACLLLSSAFVMLAGPALRPAGRAAARTHPALASSRLRTALATSTRPTARPPTSAFPPYLDESFKQNMLKQVAAQQARYPHQVAGASNPGRNPLWTSLGPATDSYTENGIVLHAKDSGRLRSILPNPHNPEQLYVLTAGGGLWRTDNLGAQSPNWQPLSDGGSTTSGGAAALGRGFDTVYVGLGDPFETTPALGGVMTKSHNGGATFNAPVSLPGASQVREVAVDTSAAQDIVLVGTDIGLFRSTDAGMTYTQVTGGSGQALAGLGVWSIKKTSAGWLLTAVSANLAVAASSPGAVAVSTDQGASWTAIPGSSAFSSSGRITVAVGEPGDTTVYAIASDTTGYAQSDMFKSVDGGLNWTALGLANKTPTNAECDQPDMNLLHGQAYYNQSLLVDPSDATRNTIYAGGNLSLAKTTDGGNSFTIVGDWLPGGVCPETASIPYVHADHHTNAVIKNGANRTILAFGSDGGLFLTNDGGAHFDSHRNSGIVSDLTQTVASSPGRDETVVSGLQDNGVRARKPNTQDWNQIFGGDGEGVGASQANTRTAIVSGYYLNIYGLKGGIPANVGLNAVNNRFYYAQNGLDLTDPDYFPFFTPIATPTAAADPHGGTFFTLTGSTFYKTKDGGNNWAPLIKFTDSSNNPLSVFRLSWNEIGVSPTDLKKIAVGGTSGHAVITTDNFHHLNYVSLNNLGLGYASFNSSAAWAPNDSVYFSSQAPTVGAVRVLKTADYGATWSGASNGLPDVPVNQVIADNADTTGNTLYAATWIGVYVTKDGGSSWSLFGAGLPTVQVSSIAISPVSHKLRAATYGRGVWEIQP